MSIYLRLNDLDNRFTAIENVLNVTNGNLLIAGTFTANDIIFKNNNFIPDSSISGTHESDGSSKLVFHTTPPGDKTTDRRNYAVRFVDTNVSSQIQMNNGTHEWLFLAGKNTGSAAGEGGFAIYNNVNPDGSTGTALKIDKDKNVTINANLTINGANLSFNSGYGIDFSATSDGGTTTPSELFNDYEQGTWTPVIKNAVDDLTKDNATGANQPSGRYIKVGNLVFLEGNLRFKKTGGTPGSQLYIEVPFKSKPTTGYNSTADICIPAQISGFGPFAVSLIQVRGELTQGSYGIYLNKVTAAGTSPSSTFTTSDASTANDTDNHLRFSITYVAE
jgi:hypothetical protein